MKAMFDKMEVSQIIFESGEKEVMVSASVQKGSLSYDTELVMTHTDLNILINKIRQCNEDIDISELFDCERMYNGNFLYTLDMEKKLSTRISLEAIEFNHSLRQIRA